MEFDFEDPSVVEVRESYLLSVQESLGADISARERFETIQELRVHLGLIAHAEVELGVGPEEAMRSAVARFGTPEIVSTHSKVLPKVPFEESKRIAKCICVAGTSWCLTFLVFFVLLGEAFGDPKFKNFGSIMVLSVVGSLSDIFLVGLVGYAIRLKPFFTASIFALVFAGVSVTSLSVESLVVPTGASVSVLIRVALVKGCLFFPLLATSLFGQWDRRRLKSKVLTN